MLWQHALRKNRPLSREIAPPPPPPKNWRRALSRNYRPPRPAEIAPLRAEIQFASIYFAMDWVQWEHAVQTNATNARKIRNKLSWRNGKNAKIEAASLRSSRQLRYFRYMRYIRYVLGVQDSQSAREHQFSDHVIFVLCPGGSTSNCYSHEKYASGGRCVCCVMSHEIGLVNFVRPLRASSLLTHRLRDIVFYTDPAFVQAEWPSIANFPRLYVYPVCFDSRISQ